MAWLEELSPLRNWQGWVGSLGMIVVLSLPGQFGDGPEDRAAYDRAARKLQAETR